MAQITRRNFLEVAGAAGALGALAACDTKPEETPTDEGSKTEPEPQEEPTDEPEEEPEPELPGEDEYPIDPDGDDVEALWESKEMGDGWIKVTQDGSTLGALTLDRIIQVDGLAFKDMNGNGKLDLYEDWRQPANVRATALANMMDPEEITKYLVHDGTQFSYPLGDGTISTLERGQRGGVTRGNANENNYISNIEGNNAVQAWCEENDPYGITYLISTDPYQINDLPDPHCITAAMDPDIWRKNGMWTGRWWNAWGVRCNLGPQCDIGTNAVWTRLGGSMSEDPKLNRDLVKAFCSGMQSTWGDDDATDDLGWGEDSVACMLKHYVGPGATEGGRNDHGAAGKYCIFPGDNFEAHLIPFIDGGCNLDGKTEQVAAIMTNYGSHWYGGDGEATEEEYKKTVGGAYNHEHMSAIRSAGWDGFVTTDYGIFNDGSRVWGVEDLTLAQRYERMMLGTVDTLGGTFNPEEALNGYHLLVDEYGQEYADANMREAMRRIAKCLINTQMFENPYSDRQKAKAVLESDAFKEFARECSDKCIVMIKNKGDIVKEGGIEGKPKAYIPRVNAGGMGFMFGQNASATSTPPKLLINEDVANEIFDVVTDNVDADNNLTSLTVDEIIAAKPEYVVLKLSGPSAGDGGGGMSMSTEGTSFSPISLQYGSYTADKARDPSYAGDMLDDGTLENRSYKGVTVSASNIAEMQKILDIRAGLPDAKIICIIETTNNTLCVYEFEEACDVILFSWCWSGRNFTDSYADILAGKVEPYGLLPCQIPADMDTVETALEDVPRDLECHEDTEGNVYDFAFGLNWSGQIKDERYETYSAEPLTKLEADFDYEMLPLEA